MLVSYFFQECDAALFLLVSDGKPVWLTLFGKWKEVDEVTGKMKWLQLTLVALFYQLAVLVASLFC